MRYDIVFDGSVRRYNNFKEEIDKAIEDLFSQSGFAICPKARAFEGRCARYLHKKHALVVDSTVDTLAFAFRALGVQPGDEIITMWNPFTPVTGAILCIGAVPVYVDCEPGVWTMNPGLLEAKITSKTKLIVPIHTYGHPADMVAISSIAKKYKLEIVEECIFAKGAVGDSFILGEFAEAVCFNSTFTGNFGPSGDAAVVAIDREELYSDITDQRNHGSVKYPGQARDRLQVILATIHRFYLKHLDEWNDRRIEIASYYNRTFADTELMLQSVKPDYRHVFGLYVIETTHRDNLQQYLKDQGIQTFAKSQTDVMLQKRFPTIDECPECELPETRKHAEQCLAIPNYAEMTDKEVSTVANAVRNWAVNIQPLISRQAPSLTRR